MGLRKKAARSFRTVSGTGQRVFLWPGLFNIEFNCSSGFNAERSSATWDGSE